MNFTFLSNIQELRLNTCGRWPMADGGGECDQKLSDTTLRTPLKFCSNNNISGVFRRIHCKRHIEKNGGELRYGRGLV